MAVQVSSSGMADLVRSRREVIQEQQKLAQEKRDYDGRIIEKLMRDGRHDLFSVNWSKVEREFR